MWYVKDIVNNSRIGLFKTYEQVIHWLYKHRNEFINWGSSFKVYEIWLEPEKTYCILNNIDYILFDIDRTTFVKQEYDIKYHS